MSSDIFKHLRYNPEKLCSIGFKKEDGDLVKRFFIADEAMIMTVRIDSDGTAECDVCDKDTGEEYVLHKVLGASGDFVGKVRSDYDAVLEHIAADGFDRQAFKSPVTEALTIHVREEYKTELEFLWEKSPDFAVCRRQDNKKWYAVIMNLKKDRFGIKSQERLEVVNLRINPSQKELIVNNKSIFPAYHMNKKSWISVFLDGSVSTGEVLSMVDESYIRAGLKK